MMKKIQCQTLKFQILEYEKGKLSLSTSSYFCLVEMPNHRELPLNDSYDMNQKL